MAKAKERRARRPRQPALIPEMEPPRIKELDLEAEEYHSLKEQRMDLTKREAESKARVKDLMVRHGLMRYTTETDLECVREHEDVDTVTVKAKKAPRGENGEADE